MSHRAGMLHNLATICIYTASKIPKEIHVGVLLTDRVMIKKKEKKIEPPQNNFFCLYLKLGLLLILERHFLLSLICIIFQLCCVKMEVSADYQYLSIHPWSNYFRQPVATTQSFLCTISIMIANCKKEASEGVFCTQLQIGNMSWFPD